ncbi:MAG: GCN5 family acetyltransferase [Spirochaetia bacterium]
MVKLKEVVSRRDLKIFVKFPYTLYKDNPYWVPPLFFDEINTLSKHKNPSFEHCEARYWLACEDGQVLGRIAAIRNDKFIAKWKQKYLRFGWFDTVNRQDVVQALFEAVESWAREQGLEAVHGPLGFTDFDKEGLLVEGFKERGTLPMIYNHAYYPTLIEQLGYKKDVDWLQFEIKVPEQIGEKFTRMKDLVLERNKLKLLHFDRMKDALPYGKGIFDALNASYSDLYGVVELTDAQVESYIKQYLTFTNPDFIKLLSNQADEVVGFAIALPRLTKPLQKSGGRLFPFGFLHLLKTLKKPEELVFYLIGARPDYQNRGLNAILISELYRECIDYGIEYVQTCGELEDNSNIITIMKNFETRVNKRRRCYIRHL